MQLITENWQLGVIDDKEYERLKYIIQHKFTRLELKAPHGSIPKLSAVARTIRLFDDFPSVWVSSLDSLASVSVVGKGE